MADLEVRVERKNGCALLAVSGELDLSTVELLHDAVAAHLSADAEAPAAELVLDLGGVTFIDSSGLGALLRIRHEVQSGGGHMTITSVASGPARVIAIAGLSETFGLTDD